MGCRKEVTVWVDVGFQGKNVERKCGDTGVDGNEIRCEKCSQKRPWYICPHGRDTSEYDCGQCEGES